MGSRREHCHREQKRALYEEVDSSLAERQTITATCVAAEVDRLTSESAKAQTSSHPVNAGR